MTRIQPATPRQGGRAMRTGVAIAIVTLAACGTAPPPSAQPSPASAARTASPSSSDGPSGGRPAAEQPFADAWLAAVETFDREATDLMIANPLSEYDLVGARLIELIERTRGQLTSLESPARLRDQVRELGDAIDAVLAQLGAIEPHGPRTEQATEYQLALDEWIAQVVPLAEAIRDALGLEPVPGGDLQL